MVHPLILLGELALGGRWPRHSRWDLVNPGQDFLQARLHVRVTIHFVEGAADEEPYLQRDISVRYTHVLQTTSFRGPQVHRSGRYLQRDIRRALDQSRCVC